MTSCLSLWQTSMLRRRSFILSVDMSLTQAVGGAGNTPTGTRWCATVSLSLNRQITATRVAHRGKKNAAPLLPFHPPATARTCCLPSAISAFLRRTHARVRAPTRVRATARITRRAALDSSANEPHIIGIGAWLLHRTALDDANRRCDRCVGGGLIVIGRRQNKTLFWRARVTVVAFAWYLGSGGRAGGGREAPTMTTQARRYDLSRWCARRLQRETD